jgi:K+-sensing histidine kinase KdpD
MNDDIDGIIFIEIADINSSIGLLLQTLEDPDFERDSRRNVYYEVSRLKNNLSQLKTLYSMEKNELSIHIQECYVLEIIEDVIVENKYLLESRDIQIECLCGDGLNWYLDSTLISGVINNAILSAGRYTKDKIVIQAVVNKNNKLTITIDDNGYGYPESVLEDFKNTLNGDKHFSEVSQGASWYYCTSVISYHTNQDKIGLLSMSNDSSIGGSRFQIEIP